MTMSAFSSKCTHERDFPEMITQFLCADVSIKNCCQSLPDFLPVQKRPSSDFAALVVSFFLFSSIQYCTLGQKGNGQARYWTVTTQRNNPIPKYRKASSC